MNISIWECDPPPPPPPHTHTYTHNKLLGWTYDDSPDEAQLKELGDGMNIAIFAVHGKSYTSQKSIGLYKTTGTASDWSAHNDMH